MIKLVYCLTRREDVSDEEFYRYWLEEHGPLVKSVAADIGACRYVQSHTIMPEMNVELEAGRGLQPAYDGITEVWWDNEETFAQASSPAGQAATAKLAEDEARFIDFSRSRVFMTEEHKIF